MPTYRDHDIENNVCNKKECIPPTIREFNVERSKELVANPVLAITASRRIIRVVDITTDSRNESFGPLLARLS